MGAALQQSARRDYLAGAVEGDEMLLETCDVTGTQSDAFSNGGSRSYPTLVPWDVPFRLAVSSCFIIMATFGLLLTADYYEYHSIPPLTVTIAVITGLGCGGLWVLCQIPRRVTRNTNSLIVEFFLHSHTVPLDDVLELVVLQNGRHFWRLLRKWKVFPSGQKLRLFFGAPSNAGSLCVLLTRKWFWSFVFCLEDPVQFLLDNQRPLNKEATYRAANKCVLREDEDLESERIGTVPKGARLKVLEQRGRRVRISLEGSENAGWMSYLSAEGVALLVKPKERGEQNLPGTIGASELSRTDGSVMELGLVGKCHE